jgi:hypothetical protein
MHSYWEWLVFHKVPNLMALIAHQDSNQLNRWIGQLLTEAKGEENDEVKQESGTRNRRFPGHWRSDREETGRGWSQRGHHLREGLQRGFRRGQSN